MARLAHRRAGRLDRNRMFDAAAGQATSAWRIRLWPALNGRVLDGRCANGAQAGVVSECYAARSARGRVGRLDCEGLLDAKLQHRFAWHADLLAPGEHLDRGAGARADACANRRALASAGDGTDYRAQRSASADFLRAVGASGFPG